MTNKRLHFFFFAEKILLGKDYFSIPDLKEYLYSKRNSVNKVVSFDTVEEIPENDPYNKLMIKIYHQFNQFIASAGKFKARSKWK